MQRDIDILLAHRETLFPGALQDHAWPRVFLGQALLEQDVQLECSTRVSPAGAVRSRPSMGFVERVNIHLARCLARLEHYGPGIDPTPVRRFFDTVDTRRADLLIHGLELSAQAADSRIKIHVRFDTDDAIRETMLSHPQSTAAIEPLIAHAQVTIGFDLFDGGRTRLRNYLSFLEPGRQEALFVQHFGSRVGEAMTEASNIWLAWKNNAQDPFVYFVDADATRFVERLGLTGVDPALRRYQGIPAYIFGAQLSALKAGVLSDYNLYYMLGR